jgi:hypothetical protein
MTEVQNAVPEIVINGVTVVSIADYAKRRHLKVAFVQNTMIKGDDQNPKIEPVYKLGTTGMYSIEELDAAYLTRGSKGITLASMGYLHPAKAVELESRIRELIMEKVEIGNQYNDIFNDIQEREEELTQARDALYKSTAELQDVQEELARVKARLFRAEQLIESGQKEYDKVSAERDELFAKVRKYEELALENGRNATDAERAAETLRSAIAEANS